METLNSIGFVNLWGVTPAYNVLQNEYEAVAGKNNHRNGERPVINILINNTSDFRHVIKTIINFLERVSENELRNTNNTNDNTVPDAKESTIESNEIIIEKNVSVEEIIPNLHFYFYEFNAVNLARLLLCLTLINDRRFSIRDRVEFIMEIYGNTLLSARTALYLDKVFKDLIRFITSDDIYKGGLSHLIDISLLTYKEKDEIAEIFSNYSSKIPFDVEKYRDDRLRFHYKDRYDVRDNLADWDYNMNLRNFAGIIRSRHYLDFRRSGVAFELRFAKYNVPNRSLGSYIPGREVIIY